MGNALFSQYRRQNLKELIELLKKDYYDIIAVNCTHIHNLANDLSREELSSSDSQYVSICAELATDIKNDIHMSDVIISPYVHELHEKVSSSHDCTNCTGKCHLNHSLQLRGVKAAHEKVKELLNRVGQMNIAAHEDHNTPATKVLHNEIACLDTILAELFYLEEAILIPKIAGAQTEINAVS